MAAYSTRNAAKKPGPKAGADVRKQAAKPVKTINLALQGGGAHGGFTWGVLDRLLEEENLAFEGISATSAGAMNGAVLAYGLAVGGREGAREALAAFWRRISDAARLGPLQPSPIDWMRKDFSLSASPAFTLLGFLTRVFSPYQLNPMNLNPLRDAVEKSIDFAVLKRPDCPVKLFLSATNVRTGKIKVFEKDEISALAVLASACLPTMFQAVEIDGEAYWDGGYMGNPALFPLIYQCRSADILIVHLNPLHRSEIPRTADEILNRMNELSFNSTLMREMRAVSFVTKFIGKHGISDPSLKNVLIHSISNDELMNRLNAVSKYNADWDFLAYLRDEGRRCASDWLAKSVSRLGVESTIDIDQHYL
jgi:NTE family protein